MVGGGSESDATEPRHNNQARFDYSESCPNPNQSSGDSGDSTPDGVTKTRFWRRRPLDLLKMVEGHFTIDDETPSPWEVCMQILIIPPLFV